MIGVGWGFLCIGAGCVLALAVMHAVDRLEARRVQRERLRKHRTPQPW